MTVSNQLNLRWPFFLMLLAGAALVMFSHRYTTDAQVSGDLNDTDEQIDKKKEEKKPRLPDRIKAIELKAKILTKANERLTTVAQSPDQRWLAVAGDDGRLLIYDLKQARVHFSESVHGSKVIGLGYSGKRLISADQDGQVLSWDLQQRRALKRWVVESALDRLWVNPQPLELDLDTPSPTQPGVMELWRSSPWLALSGEEKMLLWPGFQKGASQDYELKGDGYISFQLRSKLLFMLHPKGIRVYQGSTSLKQLFGMNINQSHQLVISPDTQWMIPLGDSSSVPIYSSKTGQDVGMMRSGWFGVRAGAFSPDGRYFIGIGTGSDTRVWDMKRQQTIAQIPGDASESAAVMFSRDGRQIFLVRDGELSVVDFSPVLALKVNAELKWDEALLINAWKVLLSRDTASHSEAKWLLIQGGDLTVKFLAGQIKSGEDIQARVAANIKALNAASYEDRQKAEEDLVKLGKAAQPALQQLSDNTDSAEARWRAQRILKRITDGQIDAQEAMSMAAAEILAAIGSKKAMKDLEILLPRLINSNFHKEAELWLERLKQIHSPPKATTRPYHDAENFDF